MCGCVRVCVCLCTCDIFHSTVGIHTTTDPLHNCFNSGPVDTLLFCELICFINCTNDVVIAPGLVVMITFRATLYMSETLRNM